MYMYIKENLLKLEDEITQACVKAGRTRDSVRLIAVSKTKPVEAILAAISFDCTDFGENRPQELLEKTDLLTGNFNMHLVGQLQSNKVRKVVGRAKYIHSVDSVKLLEKIDEVGCQSETVTNVLVQVNTSQEESKSGCDIEDALRLCDCAAGKKYAKFCGLMTIGPLTDDIGKVEKSFETLAKIGEKVGNCELSMGMSGDFALAIQYGATMIRIGTRIFNNR